MNRSRKQLGIAATAIMAAATLLLCQCAPNTGSWRQEGFRNFYRHFDLSGDKLPYPVTVYLERVKIVIVDEIPGEPAINGLAWRSGKVMIKGRVWNGRIIVNQAVLGHEITHLLNFQNHLVMDPDKYAEEGL